MGEEAPIDSVLLRRYCGGCEVSFETLVSRYERPVYGIAAAIAEDAEIAERVLADVFIALARQAEELLGSPSLFYFIFRTLKKALTEQWQECSQVGSNQSGLRRLPVSCSFTYVLRHIGGLSRKAIAELEQVSEHTVSMRLRRSYIMLQSDSAAGGCGKIVFMPVRVH